MQEEKYTRNENIDPLQPDPQLVHTVVAVIQALQSAQAAPAQQSAVVQTTVARQAAKAQGAENTPKTIDLIGLMFYVLEKFWIVLLAAIIAAGAMGYSASRTVPTYTATSKLYIVDPDSSGINIADLQLGTVLTLDYQEVFKTWEVHEMVREELNLPYPYEVMQSFMTVSNPEDTRVLYIEVTYPDAQMAADIANAYARAAKEFIMNTMRGEMPSDFSIALVPGIAHTTSKTGALIKGFLLGSVLSVGILTLLFVLDDRPRTPEDISMYGGIPTLAVLPSTKEMKKKPMVKKYGHRETGRQKAA